MKSFYAFAIALFSTSLLQAQDVITLKTGQAINGKVAEVGVNEIKYYRSDNPDGPVYVTPKTDVAQIAYANGAKDVFGTVAAAPQTVVVERPARRYRYRSPYSYPVVVPHIDLGHHVEVEHHVDLGHHGDFGGHGGGHH